MEVLLYVGFVSALAEAYYLSSKLEEVHFFSMPRYQCVHGSPHSPILGCQSDCTCLTWFPDLLPLTVHFYPCPRMDEMARGCGLAGIFTEIPTPLALQL